MSEVVLLLGFVDAKATQPSEAAPHRRLSFGDSLDAIVINVPRDAPEAREVQAMDLALAQISILSAYAAEHDVLPVALGAAFSGDDALLDHLTTIAPRIQTQRAALVGRSEWIVAIDSLSSGAAVPKAEAPGYLRRRQAEIRARHDMEAARGEYLSSVVRAFGTAQVRLGRPQSRSHATLATIAALVHRAAAETARAKLEELAPEGERLGLALRLIGPCAPFSFTLAEEADG
jgi:hypothetical protein